MEPSTILVLFLQFIFVINVVRASGFEPLAERLLEAHLTILSNSASKVSEQLGSFAQKFRSLRSKVIYIPWEIRRFPIISQTGLKVAHWITTRTTR
jgi:hypothetical protein